MGEFSEPKKSERILFSVFSSNIFAYVYVKQRKSMKTPLLLLQAGKIILVHLKCDIIFGTN